MKIYSLLLSLAAFFAASGSFAADDEPTMRTTTTGGDELYKADVYPVTGKNRMAVDSTQAGAPWSISGTVQQGAQGVTTSPWYINLRNAAGTEIGTASNPVRIDPTGTTPQPASQSGTWTTGRTWNLSSSDIPLVSQGTAAAAAGAWPVKITDGTNTTAVKAGSTAAGASDPSAVVALSPNSPVPTGTNTIGAVKLVGDTDATKIGNVLDRLKIDDGGTAVPMINRTDVSTTVSTSGSSSAFDTAGMASINYSFNVSAISGAGAYIQFHAQTSDDGTNWITYLDTSRLTATGLSRFQSFRQAGRYYRFTWDVAGTTPSVTFSIVTTLKPFQFNRKSVRFFYSDIDLTANGNVSSVFNADDCHNIGVFYTRGADGGNNGTVAIQGSLDQSIWATLTGNLAANPSTINSQSFADTAYRFYQFIVIAHTSAGTRTLDTQWSCN